MLERDYRTDREVGWEEGGREENKRQARMHAGRQSDRHTTHEVRCVRVHVCV